MDYTTASLSFRARKALRYVRLYGFMRTWVKVQAQYHMKRRFSELPHVPEAENTGRHVGLVGCGAFGYGVLAYYLTRQFGHVLRGVMDSDIHRAASLCVRYRADYYTDDFNRLLSDPAIDLIVIASNHASHADYAIAAIKAGKAVHIEKPHVVSRDQLTRLCTAMAANRGRVNLGFNRPQSRIGGEIQEALRAEAGPSMLNWFVAGHQIEPDHWYCNDEEGGRVLGNLCHWTDFILQIVPASQRYPIVIRPAAAGRADSDIAVTYAFGDGTVAAITFSAKGYVFEGVRERFAAQRGNMLLWMDDFHDLVIERGEEKRRVSPLFRDHGHARNVARSYALVRPSTPAFTGCSLEYVWQTADLFLRTKQAVDENREIVVASGEPCTGGVASTSSHTP
jgi:predicted dehydrogenase